MIKCTKCNSGYMALEGKKTCFRCSNPAWYPEWNDVEETPKVQRPRIVGMKMVDETQEQYELRK